MLIGDNNKISLKEMPILSYIFDKFGQSVAGGYS